ncbi:hypothetical protein N7475_005662 [Penicillium sp. IBT 31633x]|nr:hypothetical protein N7475_005662 [Penicillium sp. IBT 31633x]
MSSTRHGRWLRKYYPTGIVMWLSNKPVYQFNRHPKSSQAKPEIILGLVSSPAFLAEEDSAR